MIAGLPMTGIGGMFYLVLALFMPIVELYRLFHGRSSWAAWKVIGVQWMIQMGVFGTLALQALIIHQLMPSAASRSARALEMAGVHSFRDSETGGLVAGSVILACTTLAIVYLVVQCLNIYFTFRRAGQRQAQVA